MTAKAASPLRLSSRPSLADMYCIMVYEVIRSHKSVVLTCRYIVVVTLSSCRSTAQIIFCLASFSQLVTCCVLCWQHVSNAALLSASQPLDSQSDILIRLYMPTTSMLSFPGSVTVSQQSLALHRGQGLDLHVCLGIDSYHL